jgi:type I restriction enzyme S subunit
MRSEKILGVLDMSFSEWKEVKLGEIINLNYGKGLSATKRNPGKIPVYSSAGITGWHDKALIEKNGIVVGRKGTVGTVYYSETPFYCIDTAYYLTEDDTNEDLKYLYYLLNHLPLKKLNTDSAVPGLNRDNAYSQVFRLPPIREQKSIAHILSTLDDKIEVNNQINKTLENMAQAIFKQWFVDFEFPNEDGEPYKSSGGEMVESDLGLIPKGWEVGKFIDLIEITSGKRPGKRSDLAMEDCKYPLVGASSIMGYTDDFNFEEKILVIGRVGTHGVVQRFNNKVWASDNTLVIKSDNYEFAYQILNQIDYKAINRGSTQPLITQTDIKNYTLIIPTEGYLNKFELLVGSLFEIHSNHCIENSKLTEIRDSLLPKLMSGEIRVPMDEEGEAS